MAILMALVLGAVYSKYHSKMNTAMKVLFIVASLFLVGAMSSGIISFFQSQDSSSQEVNNQVKSNRNVFETRDTSGTIIDPTANEETVKSTEKMLSEVTATDISESDLQRLADMPEEDKSFDYIKEKFGVGIMQGYFVDDNKDLYVVYNYPSKEYKGQAKVTLKFKNGYMYSSDIVELQWHPNFFVETDSYGNPVPGSKIYDLFVDDSKAALYY